MRFLYWFIFEHKTTRGIVVSLCLIACNLFFSHLPKSSLVLIFIGIDLLRFVFLVFFPKGSLALIFI
jgi:hypothetical protein